MFVCFRPLQLPFYPRGWETESAFYPRLERGDALVGRSGPFCETLRNFRRRPPPVAVLVFAGNLILGGCLRDAFEYQSSLMAFNCLSCHMLVVEVVISAQLSAIIQLNQSDVNA